MKKIYRSAQGKQIDVDMLRLQNEEVIAVGNMKVNARGDELGPGGVVVKTRNEAMDSYYESNAVYTKESVSETERATRITQQSAVADDPVDDLDPSITEQDNEMPVEKPALRGSLADAVAKTAKVDQTLLTPKKPIQRI
jgi:hypothetical protein